MTPPALAANLDWLPLENTGWVLAAGLVVTSLAFLAGSRLLGGSASRGGAPQDLPQRQEEEYDPFAVGGKTERRGAFRRKGSVVTVLITDQHERQQPRDGWVIDRSMGGLGLFSERAVEVGTILKVRPEHAPDLTPWIEVEVKSCGPHETGHRIHCSFLKTPPYSILLLFG